jgi:hypothetical protein
MCCSQFLAQVIGCYLLIVSLAMLIHEGRMKKIFSDIIGDGALVTVTGALSVILGLLVVLTHNVWIWGWPVVVTLFGWTMLIQGIMRLFAPAALANLIQQLYTKVGYGLMCWFWLLVSFYLIWAGFFSSRC